MGFGDLVKKQASGSTNSSSTSSSSSKGSGVSLTGLSMPSGLDPDDFPIHTRAAPQYVLHEDDGEYWFGTSGDIATVVMEKTWYSAPWEYEDAKPAEWKRVWWSEQAFRRTAHIVESELGYDLRAMLESDEYDVEFIDEAISKAANSYDTPDSHGPSHMRDCAICGERINMKYGEYQEVSRQVVCDSHTIQEVADAGLMD